MPFDGRTACLPRKIRKTSKNPSFYVAAMEPHPFGKAYWWDGSNGSFFTQDTDGDGRKEIVVVYNLTSTGTYHAVISWLVDGSYAEQTLRPNMDLDLSVRAPNGTSLGHSVSAVQNHEGVRFTTSSTGNHTFVIGRYFNSGQGDVSLGLVIRKR